MSPIFSDVIPCSHVIVILYFGWTCIFRVEEEVKQKTNKEQTCVAFIALHCVTSHNTDFLFSILCTWILFVRQKLQIQWPQKSDNINLESFTYVISYSGNESDGTKIIVIANIFQITSNKKNSDPSKFLFYHLRTRWIETYSIFRL
jgi:hypothetical protein